MALYPFEQMKSVPSGLDYSLKDFLRANKANTELLMQIAESMGVSVTSLQELSSEQTTALECIPRQNWIINGALNLWQRGTSFVSPGSGAYTADRIKQYKNHDGAVTITKSTDVPGYALLPGVQSSLDVDVTTADTSIGSDQYLILAYNIEGYDAYHLYGRTITISFWVKSYKTGIYCIALRNYGSDRHYTAEYTIFKPDTWEQKSISLVVNFSGGTNNWTNARGLEIFWSLAIGSGIQGDPGAWVAGARYSTTNQVNFLSSTSNYFRITGCQINIGSVLVPFSPRLMAQEIVLAQRYYEKSYRLVDPPGTVTIEGAIYQPYINLLPSAVYAGGGTVFYSVRKRITPTVHTYSNATGTVDKVWDSFNGADVPASYYSGGESSQMVYASMSVATTGIGFTYHWTADAEL